MDKESTFEVGGQRYVIDWEKFRAHERYMKEKEKELIPPILHEAFGLTDEKEDE